MLRKRELLRSLSVQAADYYSIDAILSASNAVRRQQEYCNYTYVARRGFFNLSNAV